MNGAIVRLGPWGKLPWQPFEALIAVLLIVAGIGAFITPSPVTPNSPPVLSFIAAALYVQAGTCMFGGLWRLKVKVEMFGLVGLLAVISFTTVTSFLYEGDQPVARTVTFLAVAWAAGLRLYELLKGRRVVQLEPLKEGDDL